MERIGKLFAIWARCVRFAAALSLFGVAGLAAQGIDGSPALLLTDEERAWIAAHPRLRVFTKTEWSPIDLYTSEGRFRGLSGDYLHEIAQRLGLKLEFTAAATLAEALDALKAGKADLLPSVARTPQREEFMAFSQSYLDVPNVYVARRGVQGVGPEQTMKDLRVAVEKGYAVISLVAERHPAAQRVEFTDSAAAVRGVSEGEADVYIGALPTTSFLVEKLLLTNLEVRSPSHSNLSGLRMGVRKEDRMLLGLIDKALATVTLAQRQDIHRRWAPLQSLLVEPSPPLQLSPPEQRLIATLPALRVAYELDFRPYTYRGADGQLAGMAADYLRLVSDKIGLPVGQRIGGAWADVLAQARRGEVDLLIAVAANEERARDFVFVGPWNSSPNVLLTRRDAAPVLDLAQFNGRRVAVLRDGQTQYLLRKKHPRIELVEVDRRDELFAAVSNGVADASFVNASLAAPMLDQGLSANIKMAGFFPELNSDLYFAVRTEQTQLAALLKRALESINDSERAAIAARWAVLPAPPEAGAEARELLRRYAPLIGVLLAALLVSVLWGVRLRSEVGRRRTAEVQLAAARDRAQALAQARQQFLTVASHEIRTPVNAVVGALGQLDGQTLAPTARELVSLAGRAAQTLSEYVNNLLDLSKADAGQLQLVRQSDSLSAALQAAVDAIAPVARPKGLALRLVLDPRLAAHHVFDAFRVRQVVLNLASNAVKYTPRGQVLVRATVEHDTGAAQNVRIEVRDDGPGIDPQRLSQLFRPYVQAGDSVTHRDGGSGLGLDLSKRLVDAMGGTITLKNLEPHGTLATVHLDLPIASGPAGPANPVAARVPSGQYLRALVIEDDRVQQLLIEAVLHIAGCDLDIADDAQQGVALWSRHRHPLVFTDMRMPGMSGLEFARWLRAQPGGESTRLIGTSADVGDVAEARAAGIERMLQKPIPPAVLTELVEAERAALG